MAESCPFLIVDRKLLFEPTGHLTQQSGKGQLFFLFLIRDILELQVADLRETEQVGEKRVLFHLATPELLRLRGHPRLKIYANP
jgi:hypothetical protein